MINQSALPKFGLRSIIETKKIETASDPGVTSLPKGLRPRRYITVVDTEVRVYVI